MNYKYLTLVVLSLFLISFVSAENEFGYDSNKITGGGGGNNVTITNINQTITGLSNASADLRYAWRNLSNLLNPVVSTNILSDGTHRYLGGSGFEFGGIYTYNVTFVSINSSGSARMFYDSVARKIMFTENISCPNCYTGSNYNKTYDNILNQMCPAGKVVNGTLSNGTLICTPDQTGASSGIVNGSNAYLNDLRIDGILNVTNTDQTFFKGGSKVYFDSPTAWIKGSGSVLYLTGANPDTDQGYDLGDGSFRWRNLFLGGIGDPGTAGEITYYNGMFEFRNATGITYLPQAGGGGMDYTNVAMLNESQNYMGNNIYNGTSFYNVYNGAVVYGIVDMRYNAGGSLGELIRLNNYGTISGQYSDLYLGTEYQSLRATRGNMGVDLADATYDVNAFGGYGINSAGGFYDGGVQGIDESSSGIPIAITSSGGIITTMSKQTGISDCYDSTAGGQVCGTSGVLTSVTDDPSDKLFKDNIINMTLDTNKFSQLVTTEWNWNVNYSNKQGQKAYGLVAQDVQKIYPELVRNGTSTQVIGNQIIKKQILTIDYMGIIGLQINKIQELESKITTLQNNINSLEYNKIKTNDCIANSKDFLEYQVCMEKL